MKRKLIILLPLLLLLCACSQTQNPQTSVSTYTPTIATTQPAAEPTVTTPPVIFEAPMVAVSMPVSTVETVNEEGVLLCTHTTQAFSLILQNVDAAQAITNDFASRTDSGNYSARMVYEAAIEDYKGQSDWMPYSYSNVFSPTRLDQSVLSLYGSQLIFDGSAGYTSADLSVTYDLLTGNLIDEISQVLVRDFSADALCSIIYAELDPLAEEGLLYADYQYTISDMFATNTPVKNWYLSNVGLCFYFMPYELAPHSVGTIVIEIPYSSLNGLLQDRFFPNETVEMDGIPVLSEYSDSHEYTQIAELFLADQPKTYVLHADGVLLDVSIATAQDNIAVQEQNVTIFAAASLAQGDAVIIHCSDDILSDLTITYFVNGQYRTESLQSFLQ